MFPAHTELGCGIRQQALEVGVVNHTLKCLSSAGHHSNRVENGETSAESISIEQRYSAHTITCEHVQVSTSHTHAHTHTALSNPPK